MLLHEFLTTTFLFLLAGVFSVTLFKRLGLASVLGYMAAGLVIGPWGLNSMRDVSQVASFAELGVVFLLFVIGLELQPRKLWSMRRYVFGLGLLQMLITTLILGVALKFLGLSSSSALICGFALSLSSTAFSMQILAEKNEMRTAHGQASFSILLFQDVVAIPALALIPFLWPKNPAAAPAFSWTPVIQTGLVLLTFIFAGRFLLRPVFRMIAWVGAREIFTSAALMIVLGIAIVMEHLGLSMALGSFLAGMLLADSEYRHEIESVIEPFKGLLLGLFFIAVGMTVNLQLILREAHLVIGGAALLIALKTVITGGLGRFFGFTTQPAASMAITISQAGEFGFVIFAAASASGVLTAYDSQFLVAVVTCSMVLTPVAVWFNDRVIQPRFNPESRGFDTIDDESPQVIIAGFGRVGQITGRLLRVLWLPFTALELDAEQVDVVRKFGNKVYYGDASRVDLLTAAGAAKAEIFVLAVDDVEASLEIARVVRENFPHLKIVARARNRQHVFDLMDLGVEHIFRETFSSSLEMAEVVLNKLGMPSAKARQAVTTFRAHDERFVGEQYEIRHDEKEMIAYSKRSSEQLAQTLSQDL